MVEASIGTCKPSLIMLLNPILDVQNEHIAGGYNGKRAKKFATVDKEKREVIDTKNQADSVLYQTEKQLKQSWETISGQSSDRQLTRILEKHIKIAE